MAGWPHLLPALFLAAAPAPSAAAPLTLERAVELALARNERALIAGETEAAAQARLWRARAFFLPELELTGTWTHRDHETVRDVAGEEIVIQSRDGMQGTAVASMTLFDARAFAGWRAARKDRDATQLEAADMRRELAFEAANAFLAVLGIQGVRDAAERRRDLARDALRDARARFDAKLVGSNDVTKAELALANAERDLIRARGEAEIGRNELGFLLGESVAGDLERPAAVLEKARAAPPADADFAAMLDARPDVLAAKRRAEMARALAAEPLARAIPMLSANATWRSTNEAGFSGREEDWWLGATASWELFDGGERYAERRERKAVARIASLQAAAAARRARLTLDQARIQLASAQASFTAAQAAAVAARKNAQETSALYEQGLASALDAATARVGVFEAEVALVREEYGLASAWLSLPDALGQDPFGKSVVQEASR